MKPYIAIYSIMEVVELKRNAKSILSVLLAMLLFIGLTGCNGEKNSQVKNPNQNGQQNLSGESLSEQLGVPSTLVEYFISDTGISVITVDAEVVVPDVSSVDVIEAIPRAFTDEEIEQFISRHSKNVVWTDQLTKEEYKDYGVQQDPIDPDHYRLWIYNDEVSYKPESKDDYSYHSIIVHYGLNQKTGKLTWTPKLEYTNSSYNLQGYTDLWPLTNGKANGCTISFEEAKNFADAEAHAISPVYEMTNFGQMAPPPNTKTGGETLSDISNAAGGGTPQYYAFRYTRHINGIPVSDDYGGESMSNDYDYSSGLGVITIFVNDEGVCYLDYHNPYDLGEVVQSNVELLPFDQILDVFANLGLLSIQHLERNADLQENTMDVYKIQLGYMAVRQPDNVNAYYYVPVWDFYGHRVLFGTGGYAHGKEFGPVWGWSELTINAIDGTIIDRDLGY